MFKPKQLIKKILDISNDDGNFFNKTKGKLFEYLCLILIKYLCKNVKKVIHVTNENINEVKYLKNKLQSNADWGVDIIIKHKHNVISLVQCKCTTKKSFNVTNSKRIFQVAKFIKENNPKIKIKHIILMTTLKTVNDVKWNKHKVYTLKDLTSIIPDKELTKSEKIFIKTIKLKTNIKKYKKYIREKYRNYRKLAKKCQKSIKKIEDEIETNIMKKIKLNNKSKFDKVKKLNDKNIKLKDKKNDYIKDYDKYKSKYKHIKSKYRSMDE